MLVDSIVPVVTRLPLNVESVPLPTISNSVFSYLNPVAKFSASVIVYVESDGKLFTITEYPALASIVTSEPLLA